MPSINLLPKKHSPLTDIERSTFLKIGSFAGIFLGAMSVLALVAFIYGQYLIVQQKEATRRIGNLKLVVEEYRDRETVHRLLKEKAVGVAYLLSHRFPSSQVLGNILDAIRINGIVLQEMTLNSNGSTSITVKADSSVSLDALYRSLNFQTDQPKFKGLVSESIAGGPTSGYTAILRFLAVSR